MPQKIRKLDMIQPLQALMPACLRGVKKYGGGVASLPTTRYRTMWPRIRVRPRADVSTPRIRMGR